MGVKILKNLSTWFMNDPRQGFLNNFVKAPFSLLSQVQIIERLKDI